ncbi:TRAP transporter permease [Nitrospinota bacterium]
MSRRVPAGALRYLVMALAVAMSIYHLYIAYAGAFEPLFQRSLSYLFVAALIFLLYRGPVEEKKGVWGPILAGAAFLLAVTPVGWILWNYDYFLERFPYIHPLSALDLFFGAAAILLILEASRRTINLMLPLIAAAFLVYSYFGPYMPWELAHTGASIPFIIDHQYMTTEGLWALPMGVFSTYIFLFILFGAFLDRMGAADSYIQLAMALTGRHWGGPAKGAIVASAMTGTITGSVNANVVTTGTFTIPMMKRAGFRPEMAAAVEVGASVGGQVMPPVMGVSAFLIAEFTGIPYWEIVKVSIFPALLYFFSVYAIVHLEARKEGLKGLPRDQLPDLVETVRRGWFFLLPPLVIVYYLAQGQTVPYAGFAGIVTVVAIGALRGVLDLLGKARRDGLSARALLRTMGAGLRNIVEAMEQGVQNSLPIASACATVGIVMGALFQTGLATKFSSLVIALAHGNLLLGIFLVGIASFVLGMGLPTSASYIVLSVMAVPALLELGSDIGLSLLAAHLIVFWFSIDSSFTPPVCLPSYTAAGIAGCNPSSAAWRSLQVAKGMYIIPLLFAYTPILFNGPVLRVVETIVFAALGFLAVAAALQAYMYSHITLGERALLVLAALGLFWPGSLAHGVGVVLFGLVLLNQRRKLVGVSHVNR